MRDARGGRSGAAQTAPFPDAFFSLKRWLARRM